MAEQSLQSPEAAVRSPKQGKSGSSDRDRQIQAFLPYIKYQALRIAARLPAQVDAQDLMNAGVLGLLDALEKYDPSRNTQFKTYAEFRIRGAILDELRGMDWASRSTRTKIKRLDEAYARMEQELHRIPNEEEVASSMGLDMEEFYSLVMDARGIGLISIEDLLSQELSDHTDSLELKVSDDPFDSYLLKEMRGKIREALEMLAEREQLVLTLYYYEEMTMKEIGLALGVTESRISQIHAQALVKLRGHLKGPR